MLKQLHTTNFDLTSVKLFEEIGTYYQLTNPWKTLFKKNQLQLSNATKISRNSSAATKSKKSIIKETNKSTLKPGKCSLCFRNNRTLCCHQLTTTSTFKSQQIQRTYKAFHEVNCSSAYVIYLMEFSLCKKQLCRKERLLSMYD